MLKLVKPKFIHGMTKKNTGAYSSCSKAAGLPSGLGPPLPYNEDQKSEAEIAIIRELIPYTCDLIALNYSIHVDRNSSDDDECCGKSCDSGYIDMSGDAKLLIKLDNHARNTNASYDIYIDRGNIIVAYYNSRSNLRYSEKFQLGNPKFEFSQIIKSIKAHIIECFQTKITELNKKIDQTVATLEKNDD